MLDLTADICTIKTTVFYFKVDLDDADEENSFHYFEFDIPAFVRIWSRQFLSELLSDLPYSQRRRARLAVWEETIYYHINCILQHLRVPDSYNLHDGVTFTMDFLPTSPQAMESLGLSTDCSGTRSTGGNLLNRVELCDGGGEWRKDGGCSICLEKFDEERCGGGDDLTCMPCFHAFHYTCLAEWLKRSHSCPMCR